jgi:hypothetical protein
MILPALESKRLTPSEQKTIDMADATCAALMRPGWFSALDVHNPKVGSSILPSATIQSTR